MKVAVNIIQILDDQVISTYTVTSNIRTLTVNGQQTAKEDDMLKLGEKVKEIFISRLKALGFDIDNKEKLQKALDLNYARIKKTGCKIFINQAQELVEL